MSTRKLEWGGEVPDWGFVGDKEESAGKVLNEEPRVESAPRQDVSKKEALNDPLYNLKDVEFEQFKSSVKERFSGFAERATAVFKRAGGSVTDTAWKGLFVGAKMIRRVTENVSKGTEEKTQEGLSSEKVSVAEGSKSAWTTNVRDTVESTLLSVKNAIASKTRERVDSAREAVRSGVESVVLRSAFVYEEAQRKANNVWDSWKRKINDIKVARLNDKLRLAEIDRQRFEIEIKKAKGEIPKDYYEAVKIRIKEAQTLKLLQDKTPQTEMLDVMRTQREDQNLLAKAHPIRA